MESGYRSDVNFSALHDDLGYPIQLGNGQNSFDSGEMTWLLCCVAIVWLMIPGIGYFYNGTARKDSSLQLSIMCLWTCAVVSVQWYLIGYSLCLSDTGSPIIGNLDHLFLRNIHDMPNKWNPKIPAMLAGIWYALFACITPCIIFGGAAERARLLPSIIFVFFWSTFVFDFLTYWAWNANGWSYRIGALDFGGGSPVHISTAAAALAYALVVGKRLDTTEKPPHNMNHVYLGVSLIWFGWLVANAGSGLSPNLRAVNTFITTNLAASVGAITWGVIDYFRHGRKWSALGFCVGVICGLVSITPASGYVSPSSSLLFGVIGSLACNFSMSLKKIMKIDDTFDVFCVHGIGGIVGNLLTGIFAQKYIAALDGTEIEGGWLDGNWVQLGLQALDTVASFGWSFIVSLILLLIINKIPGLHLRADEEAETKGMDKAELGESHYQYFEDAICVQTTTQKDNDSNVKMTKNGTESKNMILPSPFGIQLENTNFKSKSSQAVISCEEQEETISRSHEHSDNAERL